MDKIKDMIRDVELRHKNELRNDAAVVYNEMAHIVDKYGYSAASHVLLAMIETHLEYDNDDSFQHGLYKILNKQQPAALDS